MKRVICILLCAAAAFSSLCFTAAADTDDKNEAQKLYEALIGTLEDFGSTENDQLVLSIFEKNKENDGELYARATFKPAQNYYDMSLKDRYILYITYLSPFKTTNLDTGRSGWEDYQEMLDEPNRWDSMVFSYSEHMAGYAGEDTLEAYKALMDWNKEYYLRFHDVYDFTSQKSFLDYAHESCPAPEKLNANDYDAANGKAIYNQLTSVLDRYIVHDRFRNKQDEIVSRDGRISEVYARATGKTAAEYTGKSPQEKYYLYITYLGLYEELENISDYNESFDYWFNYTCYRCRAYSELYTEEFDSKYEELMRWCYGYYMTNKKLYSFGELRDEPAAGLNDSPSSAAVSDAKSKATVRNVSRADSDPAAEASGSVSSEVISETASEYEAPIEAEESSQAEASGSEPKEQASIPFGLLAAALLLGLIIGFGLVFIIAAAANKRNKE